MNDLEQMVFCPNCEGHGWKRFKGGSYHECPVCETRGRLIIDGGKTLELPAQKMPRDGIHGRQL